MIILTNQVLQCNSQKRGYKIRNFILRAYTEIHLEGGFFFAPPPRSSWGGGQNKNLDLLGYIKGTQYTYSPYSPITIKALLYLSFKQN